MKKDNLPTIKTEDLPEIPPQILKQFPKMTDDEQLELRMIAYKTTDFFKWMEAYMATKLSDRTTQGADWLAETEQRLNKHLETKPSLPEDSEEMKAWKNEEKRLRRMHESIANQWLAFGKELRVIVQTHLSREQPKKVEVTQVKVSPGDVANLINNARKIVDVQKSEE